MKPRGICVFLRAAALAVALGMGLTLTTVSAASAHDGLVGSSPAVDSTVTSEVTSIDLTFSQDFLNIGSSEQLFAIQVAGPDENFYNLGCVTLDEKTISTVAALGESGAYTVVWQVLSSDGHPTSDSYTFFYEKPEGVEATAGASDGVTCNTAGKQESSTIDQRESAPQVLPWVIGGTALVILISLVVYLVGRGKSSAA